MTDLRLFSGIVQMRRDMPGNTELSNEHWTGWHATREQAIGEWISKTTANFPGWVMSYHACHDITDIALKNLEWPS